MQPFNVPILQVPQSKKVVDSSFDNNSEESKIKEKKNSSNQIYDNSSIEKILGVNKPIVTDCNDVNYFIKKKNQSYMHTEWVTYEMLIQNDSSKQLVDLFLERLKTEKLKESQSIQRLYIFANCEIEADWYIPESVINIINKVNSKFLIKWRNLPLSESTWETENSLNCKVSVKNYLNKIKNAYDFSIPLKNYPSILPSTKNLDIKNHSHLSQRNFDGVSWLFKNIFFNRDNILADEIRSDRYIQVISLFNEIKRNYNVKGPFLILTTIPFLEQWIESFRKWSELFIVPFYGTVEDREVVLKNCLFDPYNSNKLIFNVLLVPVNFLSSIISTINSILFHYVIVDDFHKLDTPQNNVFQLLENIFYEHCTFLTGIVIQNSFLQQFVNYVEQKSNKNNSKLDFSTNFKGESHINLSNYIMRRTIENTDYKPSNNELVVELEFTPYQYCEYLEILKANWQTLVHESNTISFRSIINYLLQIGNHPFLIPTIREKFYKNYIAENKKSPDERLSEMEEFEILTKSSNKLAFLQKFLEKNSKIIIISHSDSIIKIIEKLCITNHHNYIQIYNTTNTAEAAQVLANYMNNEVPILLFSGMNCDLLQTLNPITKVIVLYDYVFFDTDFLSMNNFYKEIYQLKNSTFYYLINQNSVEYTLFTKIQFDLKENNYTIDEKKFTDSVFEKILQKNALSLINYDYNQSKLIINEDNQNVFPKRITSIVNHIEISSLLEVKAMVKKKNEGLSISVNQNIWELLSPNAMNVENSRSQKQFTAPLISIPHQNPPVSQNKEKNTDSNRDPIPIIEKIFESYPLDAITADGNSTKKIYLNALIWCAYNSHGRPPSFFHLIQKLVGDPPQAKVKHILKSYPFNSETWISSKQHQLFNLIHRANQVLVNIKCLCYLSNQDFRYPFPNSLTPGLPCWWNPIDDYSLVYCIYKYGIENFYLTIMNADDFKWRIDACGPFIFPARDLLIRRYSTIITNIQQELKDDSQEDHKKILNVENWVNRQRNFLPFISLDIDFINRLYTAMLLNGIEFHSSYKINFVKLQNYSNLNFLDESVFANYATIAIYSLIQAMPSLGFALARRLENNNNLTLIDFKYPDREIIQRTAKSVFIFHRLRALLPIISGMKDDIPKWNIAPDWWSTNDDIKLAKVIAKNGLGSITAIITDSKSPLINRYFPFNSYKWIMYERMMLIPTCPLALSQFKKWLTFDNLMDRIMVYINSLDCPL